MAGRDIDARLSRLERRQGHGQGRSPQEIERAAADMRVFRAMSTPDLERLEGILMRVEGGDLKDALTCPAVTSAEREWCDEILKRLEAADAT